MATDEVEADDDDIRPAVFEPTTFEGAIVLKDWTAGPDGQTYFQFVGLVTIIPAITLLGFANSRSESNWVARVEGKEMVYHFPGCQVRSIVQHKVRPSKFGANAFIVP